MIANVLLVLLTLTGVDTSCLSSNKTHSYEAKTPGENFTDPQSAFQQTPSYVGESLWLPLWVAP